MCTFKEVRLALAVAAQHNVDVGVELVEHLLLIRFEVLDRDGLHPNLY